MTDKTLVYPTSAWSEAMWDTVAEEVTSTPAIELGKRKAPGFDRFAGEVFGRLHEGNPDKVNPTEATQGFHNLATEIETHPDFARLASMTRNDSFMARIASEQFLGRAADGLKGLPDAHPETPDPADAPTESDMEAQRNTVRDLMRRAKEMGDNSLQADIAKETVKGKAMAKAKALAERNQNNLKSEKVKAAIRDGIAKAAGETLKAQQAMMAIGCGSEQGGETLTTDEKVALWEAVRKNPNMQKIIDLAGRVRVIAKRKRSQKDPNRQDQVVGVTVGRDLPNALASELAMLVNPETRPLFLASFVEGTIMSYKMSGKTPKDRGPIVVCLDSSGSMDGDRIVWAKALTLGIVSVANGQKRAVRVIHYDSDVRRVDDFPKPDPTRLLHTLAHFYGGGTDFDHPVNAALDVCDRDGDYPDADIVFITDGQASLSPDVRDRLNKAKASRGLTLHGVTIGSVPAIDFADRDIPVTELTADETEPVFEL